MRVFCYLVVSVNGRHLFFTLKTGHLSFAELGGFPYLHRNIILILLEVKTY